MNTTLQSLKALYVKFGGSLTDTYEDIAGGAAVGDYTVIPDAVDALAKLDIGGGGEGGMFTATFEPVGVVQSGPISVKCDKTFNEIMTAYANGPIALYYSDLGYKYFSVGWYGYDEVNGFQALFNAITPSDNGTADYEVVLVSRKDGDEDYTAFYGRMYIVLAGG